jgi:hypothetical protein
MELFDFLNSINYDKKALLDGEEKDANLYKPYQINRGLSFFVDTIFYSNEMNCNWQLDKKMQFDFYRLAIRKMKRFSRWTKKETQENIELIKEVFGYTDTKAQEVLNIFSPKDFEELKKSLYKGGTE